VTLLRSGGEYFPALAYAIDRAEREVWLETYIFADDDVGASSPRRSSARRSAASSCACSSTAGARSIT
jgi:cardiolipin synthase